MSTRIRWSRRGVVALMLAGLATPASAQHADLIMTNGFIYTVNPSQPSASALAIRDGEIVYVGSDAGALAWQGPQTQMLALAGRMAMPGAHDTHIHLLEAFHPAAGTCPLPLGIPIANYIPIIQACAPNQVGTNWVVGYGHSIFDMHQFIESGGNPRNILDLAVPDKPAVMLEFTSHSVWANSMALAAAGFTATRPNPPGGVILKDPVTGQPNGILIDSAGEIVMDLAFALNPALDQMNYDALLSGLEFANRYGITSYSDARVYWKRGYVEAYERARDLATLTARVNLGLWAYPYETGDSQQIADLISMYTSDLNSRLRINQVKIYSDGEIEHTSAALLQPYQLDATYFDAALVQPPVGLTYFDQARLTNYITQLEAAGFDMHIHAIGDRGASQALNAIQAADTANGGMLDTRHRLTHLYLVQPADIPRFATLGVIADFQMSSDFHFPSQFSFLYGSYLSQNVINTEALRLRSIYNTGARVVLSSDYDVDDISPFAGMERSLTRGAQSLPNVAAAIKAYTIDAAYAMRQESLVGSIETGKKADIIILDQNITTVPASSIGATNVLWTLLDGEEIWRDPGFCPPVPGAPDIRVDRSGANGVRISWTADDYAIDYRVLSSPIPGAPTPQSFTTLGQTTLTTFDPAANVGGPGGAFFLVTSQNECMQPSP